MTRLRPVLRYHGGKAMHRQWIIGQFPAHKSYVEPYAGAASVLMAKPRVNHEVYNDLDSQVVNVFRVLQDPVTAEQLRQLCALTPFSREEFTKANDPHGDPVRRAWCTVVRAYMGFGSDSTTGSSTGFRAHSAQNNRAAARDWQNWPPAIPHFVQRLAGVVIENRPAVEVISQQDSPTTLFYCDPPYPHSTRSSKANRNGAAGRAHAYRYEMTDEDHAQLAEVLAGIEGMAVISGYDCELYSELYATWRRVERNVFADGGRPRVEVLWISPNADARSTPLFSSIGSTTARLGLPLAPEQENVNE